MVGVQPVSVSSRVPKHARNATPRRPPLITAAWRAPSLAALLLCSLVFLVLAVLVHDADGATGFDADVLRWLYFHLGPDSARISLEASNNIITVVGAAFAVVACLLWRRVDAAALVVLSPAAATLLTEYVLKPAVGRRVAAKAVGSEFDELTTYAFPSGHTAALTGLTAAVVIVLLRAPLGRTGRALSVGLLSAWTVLGAVGLTRNFYHYATDTIGGLLVGVVCALGSALAVDAVMSRVRVS